MPFSIEFLSEKVPSSDQRKQVAYGRIRIGAFEERFQASLSFWRLEDYRAQWLQGLTRLVFVYRGVKFPHADSR